MTKKSITLISLTLLATLTVFTSVHAANPVAKKARTLPPIQWPQIQTWTPIDPLNHGVQETVLIVDSGPRVWHSDEAFAMRRMWRRQVYSDTLNGSGPSIPPPDTLPPQQAAPLE